MIDSVEAEESDPGEDCAEDVVIVAHARPAGRRDLAAAGDHHRSHSDHALDLMKPSP